MCFQRLPAGRAALAPHDDVMGGGRMDVRRSVDLPPPGSRLQSPATRQGEREVPERYTPDVGGHWLFGRQ